VTSGTLTGHWSAQNGPLKLIVTKIQRLGGLLQLHMKAINHSTGEIDLYLYSNFVATDNVGTTYQPVLNINSTWSTVVPPGTYTTGTVILSPKAPMSAKRLRISFSDIPSQAAAGSLGGITISGIPIPR
jgi:hypothetical protein